MSEERLANALERASNAASRIETAISSRPPLTGDGENGADKAALRAAIAPILAELDAMIADAERNDA